MNISFEIPDELWERMQAVNVSVETTQNMFIQSLEMVVERKIAQDNLLSLIHEIDSLPDDIKPRLEAKIERQKAVVELLDIADKLNALPDAEKPTLQDIEDAFVDYHQEKQLP